MINAGFRGSRGCIGAICPIVMCRKGIHYALSGGLGDLCTEVKGSQVLSECCKVRYSATLARAQGHNFKGWGKVLVVEGSKCTIKW